MRDSYWHSASWNLTRNPQCEGTAQSQASATGSGTLGTTEARGCCNQHTGGGCGEYTYHSAEATAEVKGTNWVARDTGDPFQVLASVWVEGPHDYTLTCGGSPHFVEGKVTLSLYRPDDEDPPAPKSSSWSHTQVGADQGRFKVGWYKTDNGPDNRIYVWEDCMATVHYQSAAETRSYSGETNCLAHQTCNGGLPQLDTKAD
jgi:hypothetical protein